MTDPDETVRDRFMKRIAGNPRWQEAPKTGQGFVIGGAKIIALLEKDRGRALTEQEINLSLAQAEALGEL